MPVAIRRCRSDDMRLQIERLIERERFDSVMCDFLSPAPNIPELSECVLFQHNVEAVIWKRRTEYASGPVRRRYLKVQAERMLRYEGEVCRKVRKVIAVSETDAALMREWYGVKRPEAVPTGVDADYFKVRCAKQSVADFVFVGALDWAPNIDGIDWFAREVLPLILRRRADCSLTIVGRAPTRAIQELIDRNPGIPRTATLPLLLPLPSGSKL